MLVSHIGRPLSACNRQNDRTEARLCLGIIDYICYPMNPFVAVIYVQQVLKRTKRAFQNWFSKESCLCRRSRTACYA